MPLTLALDTSADVCAAAFIRDGVCLAAGRREMIRGHAEALVPMIQDIAATAGVALPDIDIVGVTRGPGSFTGLRTGIAAARGFALASGAQAVGVSSLDAVARSAARAGGPSGTTPRGILCVLETRRSDFFAQLFDAGGDPLTPPAVLDARGVFALIGEETPVLAGNAVMRLLSNFDGDPALFGRIPGDGCPDPADIAAIAEAILNKEGLALDTLSPLYLRAPEAKLPVNGGRLKP